MTEGPSVLSTSAPPRLSLSGPLKAWAKNQTGEKLLVLQDDKGGEYMGHNIDTA
ncbi:hypothetical protein OF83DRAFT_1176554 [Amylostereum chailletii]|nr:hypothetical protein OF83DRAFT_1176554 [Amylostereum chailletii]